MCIDAISYLLGKKKGGGGETPTLINKNITANGTYNASDDEADGYKKVVVDVPSSGGRDWSVIGYSSEPQSISDGYNYAIQIKNNWDSSITSLKSYFVDNENLIYCPLIDTSNVNNAYSCFQRCYSLNYVPSIDTSNVKTATQMFENCNSLKKIDKLNFKSVTAIASIFNNCSSLTDLGGFENLGMAYLTTAAENLSAYKLTLSSCVLLTHDSLMNVINNLYDIKTKGCRNQSLVLGNTNLAKLSAEEIAIATNKGWNVS